MHIGHVRMFEEAKRLGTKLVVVINNDHWKRLKGRHVFMPDTERKEIIQAFRCVDEVLITDHTEDTQDISVCAELLRIHLRFRVKELLS